ncbi:CDP-alcohol phosphatidyltransferase family protein [Candidatus Leptofilum sp.]|uniref:CDP-alcohol phosphatidyltransferase family protein n=1 Tax=Candidatus Leptofilum sp. TaxID=3241576 RepID=UPI003B5A2E32
MERLKRRWFGTVIGWGTAVALSYIWLRQVWQPEFANRWLWLTLPPLLYCLWVLGRYLAENKRAGETVVLTTFGWGNRLTLLRGLAISMVAGFLFSPWPEGWLAWLPMLLYTAADIADYLDGYLARITNHATALGERLDMEYDGLGMLIVSLLAVWYGQLPWWYLVLGLARYLFVFGLWLRARRGLPSYDLAPSVHRRVFAGFQMGFMSAVLWPIMPPEFATIAGTTFAIPTALGFLRDWLLVTGQLDPHNARYRQVQQWLYQMTTYWLPPLLRLALASCVSAIFLALRQAWPPPTWVDLFTSWGLPLPAFLAVVAMILLLLGGALVLLGAMGRLAAFWLVFPLGFDMVTRGLDWANGLGLVTAVCLMLLGTGPLSRWKPEERFLLRRAGEG